MVAAIRDLTRERAVEEEKAQLQKENITLRSTMKDRYKFGEIIGRSLAMQKVYEQIIHAAASDANVLISGESGTGKELVAHTIHEMSDRKNQVFVPVNCGAIPETLFETEFFGHRKGTFTGASGNKRGFFDIASQGTLFLDEVGELTLTMQVKLLRAIETKEYTPLGSATPLKTDVRIISATNRDLIESLQRGLLREDFLYRIHVIPIHIPPLRERKEDIPLLVDHFLDIYYRDEKRATIPGKILDELYNHDWPGNIRELQNVLNRYIALNRLDFFRTHRILQPINTSVVSWETFLQDKLTLREVVEALEKEFIANALHVNRRSKNKTAKMLGIPERTLYRKLKQYQL
jgi:transcriptional regulator with PAS, ATPase and Fis domain